MSLLTRSLFTIAIGLCIVAGSARASQVVFGNLGSSGSAGLTTTLTTIVEDGVTIAQGFNTLNSSLLYLNSVTLGIQASPSGQRTVAIFSDSSSEPGSLFATSSSVSVGAKGLYAFSFGSLALAANTTYWIVPQFGLDWFTTGTAQGGNNTPTAQNASGYAYASALESGAGTSGPWDSASTTRYSFSVTASSTAPAVPEPGTWAAAVILVGAAAYARWRRRAQEA